MSDTTIFRKSQEVGAHDKNASNPPLKVHAYIIITLLYKLIIFIQYTLGVTKRIYNFFFLLSIFTGKRGEEPHKK